MCRWFVFIQEHHALQFIELTVQTRLRFETGLWRGPDGAKLMQEITIRHTCSRWSTQIHAGSKKLIVRPSPYWSDICNSTCPSAGCSWVCHDITFWHTEDLICYKERGWQKIKYLIVKCLFKSVPRTTPYHILQTSGIHTKGIKWVRETNSMTNFVFLETKNIPTW